MTPYYSDDNCTIYHGDCRELDVWGTADVMVTDPPYGVAYISNSGRVPTEAIAGDGDTSLRDWVLEAWGARPALVFGKWTVERPPQTRHLLIWDKGDSPGMGDLAMPWGNSHEEVYVLGDGFAGKRRSNVIRFATLGSQDAERMGHPTPKPVPLLRELLAYCPPGVIIDPFMGSGTTLRAAKDSGRKAIGIEVDERYCESAVKRLAQEVLDLGFG